MRLIKLCVIRLSDQLMVPVQIFSTICVFKNVYVYMCEFIYLSPDCESNWLWVLAYWIRLRWGRQAVSSLILQKNQTIPGQNPSLAAVRSRAGPDFRCNHQKWCEFIVLYAALINSSKSYSPSQIFAFLPNINNSNTTNGNNLPQKASSLSLLPYPLKTDCLVMVSSCKPQAVLKTILWLKERCKILDILQYLVLFF